MKSKNISSLCFYSPVIWKKSKQTCKCDQKYMHYVLYILMCKYGTLSIIHVYKYIIHISKANLMFPKCVSGSKHTIDKNHSSKYSKISNFSVESLSYVSLCICAIDRSLHTCTQCHANVHGKKNLGFHLVLGRYDQALIVTSFTFP